MDFKMPEVVLSRWSALRLLFSVLKSFSFQYPFPAENLEAAIVLDFCLQFGTGIKVKVNIKH